MKTFFSSLTTCQLGLAGGIKKVRLWFTKCVKLLMKYGFCRLLERTLTCLLYAYMYEKMLVENLHVMQSDV